MSRAFSFFVVCNQTFHGTLGNMSDDKAFCTGSCFQLVRIVLGHAAYKTDRQVTTTVGLDVSLEETAEIINHQLLQKWVVKMFTNK